MYNSRKTMSAIINAFSVNNARIVDNLIGINIISYIRREIEFKVEYCSYFRFYIITEIENRIENEK